MTFQSDLYHLHGLANSAQGLRDKFDTLRRRMKDLHELRRRYDETQMMTIEEFRRHLQHLHGHLPDLNSERFKKQYDEYRDQTAKRRDEMRGQIEVARNKLVQMLLEAHGQIKDMSKVNQEISDRLKELDQAAHKVHDEFTKGQGNLTLEHLHQMEMEFEQTAWLKDQL